MNGMLPDGKTPSKEIPASPVAEQVKGDDCLISKRDINANTFAVIGLLFIVTAAILPIVKIFFVPVIVAAAFATLFFPLYRHVLAVMGKKRGLSSFICCLLIFLCLVTPTYIMVQLVVRQGVELYQSAEPVVKDIVTKGNNSKFLSEIQTFSFIRKLRHSNIDIAVPLQEGIKTLMSVGTKAIHKTSTSLFEFVFTIFVMFFTMFYFFRDGETLVKRIKYLVPIRADYEEMIASRFLLISRATVMVTVLIGVIQGTIGALALLIFGVKLWLLWGFIMIILSLIPLMGAWMVLIPAGIIQIIMGHTGQGIGIILTSFLFVSTVDNFIRPRLVGHGAKLHDLVIFFTSLGGIAVFGPLGFIVGPVIAALFVAVLDIYGLEFERQLNRP